MLHKIVYDVVFNPSKKWSRTGDGMIVIRASQGRKSVDIPEFVEWVVNPCKVFSILLAE